MIQCFMAFIGVIGARTVLGQMYGPNAKETEMGIALLSRSSNEGLPAFTNQLGFVPQF